MTAEIIYPPNKMAQTIEEFLTQDFQIGQVDTKTKIAPVTSNGKPVLITLAKTPTLTTPFSIWPSYDGGERLCILRLG